jgi:uncharacterized protein (UPF0276 family)
MRTAYKDRVGLGWRPELAAGIFAYGDEIDVVEVIADDAGAHKLSSLKTLCRQFPVMLHGVGLGLASSSPADQKRLDAMARLFDAVRPEAWTEHCAFVRGGGYEIGHLAAPPRTRVNAEACAQNLHRAATTVGSLPAMENISTLIDPPGSELSEVDWLNSIREYSGCGLLLDLHNLHANATNLGYSAEEALLSIPAESIAAVHIAGGKWIGSGEGSRQVILDDHLHPVPDEVFDLLTLLASRTDQSLTVILERDGDYPRMEDLIAELRLARVAISRGRELRAQNKTHAERSAHVLACV